MNNQHVTTGIVLARVDYGEADRIITLITPDAGKLRLIAKGVRRVKSKLAGGVELFSVTNITYIRGRGDIGTLISARLVTHYGRIVQNIDRTMLGYELIKQLNKATEDEPEPDYFHLLEQTFRALDDNTVSQELIKLWFAAQLLRLSGHTPNLQTDTDGNKLEAGSSYHFDFDAMSLRRHPEGTLHADHIKFLRLLFSDNDVAVLRKIQNVAQLVEVAAPLVQAMTTLVR
jgi:DNA repair protein RecO (recombination protein O)